MIPRRARTFAVELPGAVVPAFPRSCVLCGRSGPEPLVTVRVGDEYAMVDLCFYRIGRDRSPGPVLEVPVHDSCARLVRKGFLRWLLLSVLAAAAILIGARLSRVDVFWACMAALVAGVTLAAVPLSRPAPLEFHVQRDRVSLVFRDRRYARLVAHLNGAQVEER